MPGAVSNQESRPLPYLCFFGMFASGHGNLSKADLSDETPGKGTAGSVVNESEWPGAVWNRVLVLGGSMHDEPSARRIDNDGVTRIGTLQSKAMLL